MKASINFKTGTKSFGSIFLIVVLISLWLFCSCSSNDENIEDGDLTDGDSEFEESTVDGDMDQDENESVEIELETETDADTDGDIEEYEQAEECENSFAVWYDTPKWQPETFTNDVPFKQEQSVFLETEDFKNARSLVVKDDNTVYAASSNGIYQISHAGKIISYLSFQDWDALAYDNLTLLADGKLAASSGSSLYIGTQTGTITTVDLLKTIKGIYLSADNELMVTSDDNYFGEFVESTKQVSEWFGPVSDGLNDICKMGNDYYLATTDGVKIWNKGKADNKTSFDDYLGASDLPSLNVRSIACTANELWIATDKGLVHKTAEQITTYTGENGLPFNNLKGVKISERILIIADKGTHITRAGDEIEIERGLITLDETNTKFDYYNSRYWIPSTIVNDAVMTNSDKIFVATPAGIGIIYSTMMTMAEKAAIYDLGMYERHNRFGMFSQCGLSTPGDLTTATTHDDDNDGQWTNMYLASQVFRYAATNDNTAKAYAKEAADAMLRLLTITGKKGFFARTVITPAKCPARIACSPECGEWHMSDDEQWCWKGDTSGDEYVGHIFGLSLYYDLVADDTEKEYIKQVFVDLHDGIIENGYTIQDIDGKMTSHGYLNPEYMELIGRFGDAGLYGAMILGGLRATYHMSGEQRFMDAFNYLAYEHSYADYVSRIEEINLMTHTNHDSEEMSFLAMLTLIRYETDPCLMGLWQHGLDYLWEMQRKEHNPEFNFLYAWMRRDNNHDHQFSINTLREFMLSAVKWEVINSHRDDYVLDPKLDRFKELQAEEVYPYNQKHFMRWSRNPRALNFERSGTQEEMLIPWLLPYWLGRYLGVIVP